MTTTDLPDYDHNAFVHYLNTTGGLTIGSASVYAAHVRSALKAGLDPDDNDAFASFVLSYTVVSRTARRSAWRHYQRMLGIAILLPTAAVTEDAGAGAGIARGRLGDFAGWLEQERGCSATTTASYVSTVRTTLRALGDEPTRAQLDEYVRRRPMAFRARFPTVWRHWHEWNAGAVAAFDAMAGDVPDDVAYAAWYLAVHVGMLRQHMRELTWASVVEEKDGGWSIAFLPEPGPGKFYRQRIGEPALIVALRAWSLPADDAALVLPAECGGEEPATQQRLREIVTRGATLVASGFALGRAVIAPRPDLGDVPWRA